MITAEHSYICIPRPDVIIFVIRPRDGEPKDCRLAYDGGDHAVFYRNADDIVILDYVNPDIKKRLLSDTEVVIAEADFAADIVSRLYRVKVSKVQKCAIDPQMLADLAQEKEDLQKAMARHSDDFHPQDLPLL